MRTVGRLGWLSGSASERYPITDNVVPADDRVSSAKIPIYTRRQPVRTVTFTLTTERGARSSITVAQCAFCRYQSTEELYPRIREVFGAGTFGLLATRAACPS